MNIRRGSFPGCCGIQVLWDLGMTKCSLGDHKEKTKLVDVEESLNNLFQDPQLYDAALPNLAMTLPTLAMTLICLNTEQHKNMHKMLTRKGFKLIDKGWNKTHKNMNYLYSLHLEKEKTSYKFKQ